MLPNGPHDFIPEDILKPSRAERRWPIGLATLVFYVLIIALGWVALRPSDLPVTDHWLLTFKNEVKSSFLNPLSTPSAIPNSGAPQGRPA